jgi:hypothetical protein
LGFVTNIFTFPPRLLITDTACKTSNQGTLDILYHTHYLKYQYFSWWFNYSATEIQLLRWVYTKSFFLQCEWSDEKKGWIDFNLALEDCKHKMCYRNYEKKWKNYRE